MPVQPDQKDMPLRMTTATRGAKGLVKTKIIELIAKEQTEITSQLPVCHASHVNVAVGVCWDADARRGRRRQLAAMGITDIESRIPKTPERMVKIYPGRIGFCSGKESRTASCELVVRQRQTGAPESVA